VSSALCVVQQYSFQNLVIRRLDLARQRGINQRLRVLAARLTATDIRAVAEFCGTGAIDDTAER
jgi:hypothetical protein